MVTFVALLMFLQCGASPARATLFSALLFLPWTLKSFVRSWVRRRGHFRHTIHWIEALLFLSLVLVALSFPYGQGALFASLMLTSMLCTRGRWDATCWRAVSHSLPSIICLRYTHHRWATAA